MFPIDPDDPLPIYAQLDRAIRGAIAAGRLAAGDKLPTVRQLAGDLGINANTIARVYAALERAGILATRRGLGTFVRDNPPSPAASGGARRDQELRRLVDRMLADAAAAGIPLAEVVQYVKLLEEGKGN
ncbi:MAG TPA: GntR family transcriptional regulator [Gemmatimonadaceae bacterium]|nr:GntR family transcriptional regulator [Gemmatimonadaceae bacterium]